MKWANPFDAPPPINRALLPGETKETLVWENGPPELDPNAPLADAYKGEFVPFTFSAQWRDYFALWVVCQALTIASLGLYAPFAKARKARYLAENIRLKGLPFSVNLDPEALLKGRLLALGLLAGMFATALAWPLTRPFLVLVCFACLPWLLARALAFRWWRTSFAGYPFGYTPNPRLLRWPCWIMGLLTALTVLPISSLNLGATGRMLGIVLSTIAFVCLLIHIGYFTTHVLRQRVIYARFGEHTFQLQASAWEIYKQAFSKNGVPWGAFLSFLILGHVTVVVLLVYGWKDLSSLIQSLMTLSIAVLAVSFGRAMRFNYVMNRLEVGKHLRLESTLPPNKTALKFSGYAVLNFLTLGLAVPWTTLKTIQWRLQHLRVNLSQPWNEFLAAATPSAHSTSGAVSEGLVEQFDIDISL